MRTHIVACDHIDPRRQRCHGDRRFIGVENEHQLAVRGFPNGHSSADVPNPCSNVNFGFADYSPHRALARILGNGIFGNGFDPPN